MTERAVFRTSTPLRISTAKRPCTCATCKPPGPKRTVPTPARTVPSPPDSVLADAVHALRRKER